MCQNSAKSQYYVQTRFKPEFLTETNEKPKKISLSGKTLIAVTGGIGVALTVVCASFVAPAFRRHVLPYVPATPKQISNVFSFVPQNTKKLLDIGSGDGRIVIAAAKHNKEIQADGVELNSWLVLYSRFSALRHGVQKQTRFFRKDLWKFNVNPYDTIVIFGVEQMMKDLEQKLILEAPEAKVIACRFKLPNLQPLKVVEDGVDSIWFYDLSKVQKSSQ